MRHHVHVLRALFVALALCLGLTGVAVAQEITGSIAGTVKDANGAVVRGATVTLTDSDKKVVARTIVTDDNGAFSAPDLLSGYYDLTVEATNFKKHVETRLKLDVGQHRTADVSLEAGNISEVVTVAASAVTVELTTPTVSSVVSGDQARELSLNNRNWV